ncbi:lysine--tRNA ligase [Candidatus Gottesmanbacteria bacterium RBG_16_38_7b]|uniref:Lysine--tRNA ligase n=1 Tax=Candidatus Gottesmanbacteria bacterium RBG_16_38_7b TaxID=1798372 RepID=A0A1F5YFZ7_9BACT|nr:MAG: lysine--tRNA ligase [Candidatus Gottesmanbacteria bacterium RBG_16_38_7b]
MATLDILIKTRLDKLDKLRSLEIDPFPSTVERKDKIADARNRIGKEAKVIGRIIAYRHQGKIAFLDIIDGSGKIQTVLKADILDINLINLIPLIDIGDFIAVQGKVDKTASGEISVFAYNFQIIAKSVRPLPDKWYGLKDIEERYRKRYLDMILNADVSKRLEVRSKTVQAFRDFFNNKNYLEVETPTLQPVYGGGFARPFITHHNALDADFYLRISDEMYLKRLIVGGFEKVYEITKVFRNEGVDHEHNPEFTMFEAQIAYEDYHYGMDIVEELLEYVTQNVLGKLKVIYQDKVLNFARPWKRYRLVEAVKKYTPLDPMQWKTVNEAKKAVLGNKISDELTAEMNKMRSLGEVMAFAFEVFVEKQLIQPTIIYDYPIEVSPLAKKCEDPRFTQRFEMFVNGLEIGNNYTELNNPVDLKQRFIEEKKREEAGFEEAHQTDYDYLEAIEHGFPPACGLGIGMDRVVMLLTNTPSIKEVIPFPTLKPEQKAIIRKTAAPVTGEVISLDPQFTSQYPSACIGYAVIRNITVRKKDDSLEDEKNTVLKLNKNLTQEKIDTFPEIQSYRQMYQKMNVDLHSRRPSPEALLRRIAQAKGLYTVNTCVDAYNLIVIKNRVSLGAFDLDKMVLPVMVKVAQHGETIDLLGVEGATQIQKGEVIYSDQIGPYNLDYNYRDAERTKITDKTKNIILNVDGIYDIDEKMVNKSLEEAIDTITKYCGGEVTDAGIITADGRKLKISKFIKSDVKYDYRQRKIVAVINRDLDKGRASNALGHMSLSAGRYLDQSWMGDPLLKDADGNVHQGISKYPFVILGATSAQIKNIVVKAKNMGIFCVDYPEVMFDTGTDEDLTQALSKIKEKDLVYHAVLLAGKTKDLAFLTRDLKLYK